MHYLDTMFPVSDNALDEKFLEQVVDVDETVAVAKEQATTVKAVAAGRTAVELFVDRILGVGKTRSEPDSEPDNDGMMAKHTKHAQENAAGLKGKTVKELSRLWQYRGGKAPLKD